MGPMALAAVIVVGSNLASVTLEVGLNALQNWSDVIYNDAFWTRRNVASPELEDVAKEEAAIARLMAGSDFAVGDTARAEIRPQP